MCGLIDKTRRGKVCLPRCAFMRPRGAQTEKEGVYLMELKHDAALGYLPEERPPVGKLILYALQQVIVMFPATVTVALITGFQVSTTIFASGLATLFFILITGRKIPLYYGSSFAYLTAISSMVAAEGTAEQIAQFEATDILPAGTDLRRRSSASCFRALCPSPRA